jgi:hypothetical protein
VTERTPFELATDELRKLGVTLRQLPGEFSVNFRDGNDATARTAETLEDAVELGRDMAKPGALVSRVGMLLPRLPPLVDIAARRCDAGRSLLNPRSVSVCALSYGHRQPRRSRPGPTPGGLSLRGSVRCARRVPCETKRRRRLYIGRRPPTL